PTVQPREANAYAAPKAAVDSADPVSAGARPPTLGRRTSRPATSQAPTSTTATPSATVNHGSRRCTTSATGARARPKTVNTAAKPAVIAAALSNARPTARPRAATPSPITSADRYTGS